MVKFDPVEFAEFVEERGVEVTIVQVDEGPVSVKIEPIPMRVFQSLMKDFLLHKTK